MKKSLVITVTFIQLLTGDCIKTDTIPTNVNDTYEIIKCLQTEINEYVRKKLSLFNGKVYNQEKREKGV